MNYLKFHEQTLDGVFSSQVMRSAGFSGKKAAAPDETPVRSRLNSPHGSLKGTLFDVSHDIPYGQYRKPVLP